MVILDYIGILDNMDILDDMTYWTVGGYWTIKVGYSSPDKSYCPRIKTTYIQSITGFIVMSYTLTKPLYGFHPVWLP